MNNLDICMEVGERASKEFKIENSLREMKAIWDQVNFTLKTHKNICPIVGDFDELNTFLDEHILNT